MNTAANKKDFFYIIVLILTFITVILGATFALYSLIFSHKEGSSAVYTGSLSIEYLSGDIIKCNFLKPMEKVRLDDDKNVYRNNFRVTNTGTLDSLLSVILEINENEFSNNTVMYSLYDDEGLLIEDFLEGSSEIILDSKILLKREDTKNFTLVIWLKESGENQNEEMRKNLIGQIRVDASQKTQKIK